MVGEAFYNASLTQRNNGDTPSTVGAEFRSYLASAESDGVTQREVEPVAAHCRVPSERGKDGDQS